MGWRKPTLGPAGPRELHPLARVFEQMSYHLGLKPVASQERPYVFSIDVVEAVAMKVHGNSN